MLAITTDKDVIVTRQHNTTDAGRRRAVLSVNEGDGSQSSCRIDIAGGLRKAGEYNIAGMSMPGGSPVIT